MKKITSILSFFLLLTAASALFAQETLTNQSIISLVEAKIANKIIITKIQGSPNTFDLSAAGMTALKSAKVNEQLMEEMLLNCKQLPQMNNDDIIKLSNAGISKKIILKKIAFSNCKFDTGTDALIALKNAKVDDAVINTMMDPAAGLPASDKNITASKLAPHPQDLPAPKLTASGIYYEAYSPKVDYLAVEPTTTNQSKQGGFGESMANHYTMGISGKSTKVGLANASANMVIEDARPVFYFYVERDGKSIDQVVESSYDGVASPNDFVLIQATVTKRGREVEIARRNNYGSESGFAKGTMPFRYKKISDRLYKVYFENDVPAGEYAFYYNKGSEQRKSLKLYDFSLRNNITVNK
jgi:hypothetical protein